ncbi:MAG TPA: SH3 domain-containing protein [Bacillota bacterium]
MTRLPRGRRPALVAVLVTALSLVLTGCGFWDWLAGRPITRPAVSPAAVGGEGTPADAGDGGDGQVAGGSAPEEPDPAQGDETGPGDEAGGSGDAAGSGDSSGDPAGEPEPGSDGEGSGDGVPDRCSLWSAGMEPSPGPFEQVRLEPVDESAEDASFAAFKASLLDALARRDLAALEAAVHPQIKTDFGGGTGLEDFRRQWGLDRDPEASPVWNVLTDILNLGGVLTGGGDEPRRFTAPYVYALYNASLDPFGHAVVTGDGVNVRAQPSLEAEILDQASHLVVRVIQPEGNLPPVQLSGRDYCWVRIQLPSGEIGYIADRFLWSPVGWRAAFEQDDEGAWRLTFLVAGD